MEQRMSIPLRWADLDDNGHVNQAVYHALLEEVRRKLVEAVGGAFVMARIELDYRHEIRMHHSPVDAVARITDVGNKSFTITHEILIGDTVAAEGRAICVPWDQDTRTSRAITDAERAAMLA